MTELNLETLKSITGAGSSYCAPKTSKNDCKSGKDCS